MKRQANRSGSNPDDENPEWNAADFAKAKPAAEMLAKFIGQAATDELVRVKRGRPVKLDKKINQTLRLDADVVAAYRNEGSGWQARINQILREHMPKRPV